MALGKETHTASEVILDLSCPCFFTLGLQTPRPSWTPAQHAASDFLSLVLPRTFFDSQFFIPSFGPAFCPLSSNCRVLYYETLDMDKQIGALEAALVDLDSKILSLS